MTPYIKKIVELHKIHKAIEDKDCNGGGNTPSGDITIDDVVKFIHDNVEETRPGMFPYTTWDEIPDYNSAENGNLCKTNNISDEMSNLVLKLPNYKIGNKLTNK